MKKMLTLLGLLTVSSVALAAPTALQINCKSPSGLAGNSANVNGVINLSKHPTYPAPAKKVDGILSVRVGGSTRSPVLNTKVKVLGQFDNVNGTAYAHVGSLPDGDIGIFINFTEKDASYVEFEGKQFLMNCAE